MNTIRVTDATPDRTIDDGTYRLDVFGAGADLLIPVVKTGGYWVAYPNAETKLASGIFDYDLESYVAKHFFDLTHGASLGVWTDDGYAYLDLSFWVLDREKAIEAGRRNGQLAIWDCANGVAIDLAPVTA